MDWENLKFFLAVARAGSLIGAGRLLGVKHTTVMRRIANLEEQLGSKLFERRPEGYSLTPAGQELFGATHPLEGELVAVARKLSGLDQRLTGTVRIASLGVLSPWICDSLAKLREENPELKVEVLISPDAVSMANHEADVAVRVTTAPHEYLVGRRIATLAHGIYAAVNHPAKLGSPKSFAVYDWLAYTDNRKDLPQAKWMKKHIPDERIVMRTNHTATLVSATRAGIGVSLLPRYLGDSEPGIHCLAPIRGLGQELWLLTHQDLRHTRRVKVLMDCLAEELLKHRYLIENRA